MAKREGKPFDGIHALPSFPVVLVTAGRNIMTAAAFHFYSFAPPSVMVGILPRNLTFELISESKEFGINIPTVKQLDAVRLCGSVSGREADKFIKTGLTPKEANSIESLLIAECPVNIECRVVHRIQFEGSHTWFIGRIELVHVDEDYARDMALMFWLSEYRSVGEVLFKIQRK